MSYSRVAAAPEKALRVAKGLIGTYADIPAQEHVFAYERYDRCEGLAVLLNVSHEVQTTRVAPNLAHKEKFFPWSKWTLKGPFLPRRAHLLAKAPPFNRSGRALRGDGAEIYLIARRG
jgi:hypothetical protein